MRRLFNSKKRTTLTLSLMFFGLMVLIAFVHEEGIISVFRMDQKLKTLSDKNERLFLELDQLRREVKSLSTETESVEKIAREKLNLVKPGERVYQIVRESGKSKLHNSVSPY